MKFRFMLLFFLLGFEAMASGQKLGYSGRFTNADGSPVAGPVNVTIEILTGASGSEAVRCMSFANAVSLSNGVFNMELDFGTTCDTNTKTLAQVLKPAFTAATEQPTWIRLTTTNTSPAVVYGPTPIYATPVAVHALSSNIEAQQIEVTHLKGIASNCANGEILESDGSGGFNCIAAPSGGASLTAQSVDDLKLKGITANCSAGEMLEADGSGGFSCVAAPSGGGSGDITAVIAGTGIAVTGGTSGDATVAHADNSSVADSTNSNGNVIQSLGFDEFGHVDSISTIDLDARYLQSIAAQGVDDLKLKGITANCSAGEMLEADGSGGFSCIAAPSGGGGGGGDITAVLAGTGIIVTGGDTADATVAHADTSSASSLNQSNGVVVQDITLDDYGHITALSGTDLDTRFLQLTGGDLTGALTTTSTITATGNINGAAFLYTSDRRKKKDIKNIKANEAINYISKLQGVHFNWKDTNKKDIGFIAQDVQKVIPELVQEVGDKKSHLAVQYGNIVAIAVEALKEQNRQIKNDREKIIELEKKNELLNKKLDLILKKLESKN